MQLGFSYIGLLFLLLLFVPNLFWTKNKPSGYEQSTEDERRILLVLERTGEMLVTCTVLIFSDFNFHPFSPWSLWLAAAFLCMILYELWWIRYFRSSKALTDFYSSFCGIFSCSISGRSRIFYKAFFPRNDCGRTGYFHENSKGDGSVSQRGCTEIQACHNRWE